MLNEYLLGFLFFICLFLLIYLVGYLLLLKKNMRTIQKELKLTKEKEYNRQISITLFDRDLTNLTVELNKNLDYQKNMKLKQELAENTLKQSISDIAHDLRTPLTVIKGNLQMIEKKETLSQNTLDYLRICQEKSDVLKIMVDDFFELSVLESEQEVPALEKTDLTRLLMEFLITHEGVIKEHKLELKLSLPQKSVFVKANEMMLNRMFGNLLRNIMKYGENYFAVKLIETEIGTCRLIFSNPFAKNQDFDVNRLFDRTYRGNQARTEGGAGLGLSIVKLLADKQNIKVFAENEQGMLSIIMEFIVDY
ncbi:MAG: sensor histidine kinase [Lachnospiraceae bacterium]